MFPGNVLVFEIINPPPTLNVGLAAVVIMLPTAFMRVPPAVKVDAIVVMVKPALFVTPLAMAKLVTLLKESIPLLIRSPYPTTPKATEVIAVALVNVMVVLFVKFPFKARVVAVPEKELLLVITPSMLKVAIPVPVKMMLLLMR
jgi:hypothetical protein